MARPLVLEDLMSRMKGKREKGGIYLTGDLQGVWRKNAGAAPGEVEARGE